MKTLGFLQSLAVSMLVLSGCASMPSNTSVRSQATDGLPAIPSHWSDVESAIGEAPIDWIAAVDDPKLHSLVKEAIGKNPELRGARARLDRASAIAKEAGAALAPQVSAGVTFDTIGEVDGSQDTDLRGAIGISWEVDLWSRLSTERDAAIKGYEAVEADYTGARNLLAAGVARAYFGSIEARQQQSIARDLVSSLKEIERIVTLRAERGYASEREAALAKSDLASAQSRLIAVSAAWRDSLRGLEVLLGRYPAAVVEISDQMPASPPFPATGAPSAVLERRPDIVAAERRVAAALGTLEVARVARLPSLSLISEIGEASPQLAGIVSPEAIVWQAASNLLAPVFTGGALSARVDTASADVEAALADYQRTALNAFSEVETALNQFDAAGKRLVLSGVAERESRRALALAKISYQSGEIGLLEVLIQQQRLLDRHSLLESLKRERLSQYILLCLALGGNWHDVGEDTNPVTQ